MVGASIHAKALKLIPNQFIQTFTENKFYITRIEIWDNIADMIADIANNTSDDTELLHQTVKNIEEFMMGYKQQGN